MRNVYEEPVVEIIEYEVEDIICTSNNDKGNELPIIPGGSLNKYNL